MRRPVLPVLIALIGLAGYPSHTFGEATDIHGTPVGTERLRGHVTLVTFSTRETRARSMRLGQQAGARFGDRPGFQSLTLVNTSRLSFVLRPLAPRVVAEAEQEAIEDALAGQRARGNQAATVDEVRKRVIFVHDRDGHTWKALGVPPDSEAMHVGVIDPAGRLVHLARDPIDETELLAALERELVKLRAPALPPAR